MNKLNLLAPFNKLGYGVASTGIAVELMNFCDLYIHPINNRVDCDELYKEKIIEKCAVDYPGKAPCLKINSAFGLKEQIGSYMHIGFPIFELDKFTSYEKAQLKQLDRVFVTCDWARNVCIDNHIKPDNIHIVPLGVDREVFHETDDQPTEEPLKFFCCGKWEIRKGHDIVIEAFNKAFEPGDNVELIMNCHNPFLDGSEIKRWENMYRKSKMGQSVYITKQRIDNITSLANFMNRVDVGIFCSRAEGWNLELLEMLSCGKQCIATNVTAHTAYINKDNCRLIDCPEMEDAFDNKWFFGQGSWYSLGHSQIDMIAGHMRDFYKEKTLTGKISQNLNGIETAKRFSWKNSAEKVINGIS